MRRNSNGWPLRYRQQLYDDPQSLAGLVSISAVKGEDGLKGYRVAPGKDAAQFSTLGLSRVTLSLQ